MVSDNDPVRCWMDKSGLGNHVQAPSFGKSAIYNTNQSNAKSVLSLAGGKYYQGNLAQFSGNQAHTIFVVKKASLSGKEANGPFNR